MIWKRAGIFLMIGIFLLLQSACSTASNQPPTVTTSSSAPTTSTPSRLSSTPTTAALTAWIRSDRQTETVPEPVYEVGRDTVTLRFGANQDSTFTLYAFYDFYSSTESATISTGALKAGQEASLERVAAGGMRAFHLVVEAAGQRVTATASLYCLWVD